MKRHVVRNAALGVLILAIGVLSGYLGRGMAAPDEILPGTEKDPLVSRSYVEAMLSERLDLNVVEMKAGQTLIGLAGTEIILRAGQATAVDSELGGLSDVTAGKDVRKGEQIVKNHLLIVPRSDGRGIRAVTEAIVLVRGTYTLEP